MDEILKKIEELENKVDAVFKVTQSTRNYFRWTFWLTVALFVIPLIILIFVLPSFINTLTGSGMTDLLK